MGEKQRVFFSNPLRKHIIFPVSREPWPSEDGVCVVSPVFLSNVTSPFVKPWRRLLAEVNTGVTTTDPQADDA